jgi:ATP-dependent DNA helicase RecG
MPERVLWTLRSRYLIAPIHYEGLQRVEPLEIPEDALREMICNAIVHRDYTGTFTQMRIWADHIELWNQGTLPPDYTIDTLMQDHESYPRNTLIADAFFRAGFIEAWGRGFEKIREAFKDEQLQMPTFEQVRGGVFATIKREKFIAMQQQKDGASGASNVVSDVVSDVVSQLTETQRKIIKLIQANPFMSATQMSQVMSVVPRTVQRQLAALQKQGIIIREGNTSAKKWIVSDNVSDIPNEQL